MTPDTTPSDDLGPRIDALTVGFREIRKELVEVREMMAETTKRIEALYGSLLEGDS